MLHQSSRCLRQAFLVRQWLAAVGSSTDKMASQGFTTSSAAAGAGPTTATPPADTARGATADLCDVFIPEPVDQVAMRKVQILEPIFK
jgi:hypothetical protein